MSQITLQLPDSVASELARVGKETNRTKEAVAEEMIQRMVALRKFDSLREDVRRGFGDQPPTTEDDILNGIS